MAPQPLHRYAATRAAVLLAGLGLALAAGTGLALGWVLDGTPADQPVATPPASPAPSADCAAEALRRADAVVERSQRLETALATHTQVMDDLLADRLDVDEVVDRSLPVLTDAAGERRRFAEEVTAFQQARDACRG